MKNAGGAVQSVPPLSVEKYGRYDGSNDLDCVDACGDAGQVIPYSILSLRINQLNCCGYFSYFFFCK